MKQLLMIKQFFLPVFMLLFSLAAFAQSEPNSIPLQWLGKKLPKMETGVSWGIPFKQGLLKSSPENQKSGVLP